ncbi:MAG: hypothetical protein M3292_07795 [Actinomycetota bacterium]|nr:hypothetical protein [Actinomycetota bacterium]
MLERHGFERIESGNLVATYARSKFEDTRRKAVKFGAKGATVKAYKPRGGETTMLGVDRSNRRRTWRTRTRS